MCILICTLCSCKIVKYEIDYEAPVLISHAGGAIYGLRYTNSKQALDLSYRNGHRYIEMDFSMTTDNEIVAIHDWDSMALRMFGKVGRLSKSEFLTLNTLSDLTVMDFEMLSNWLDKHPDVVIVTDIKEDNINVLKNMSLNYKNCFKRIIPQAYSIEEYNEIKKLGFERVIFTLYATNENNLKNVINFAIENKPWALTMPVEKLNEQVLHTLSDNSITIYAHTVNDLYVFEKWQKLGLYGIYTDYFTPIGFPY